MQRMSDFDVQPTFMSLMEQGGWVMWALLAISVVALAVALERFVALRGARTDLQDLVHRIRHALVRGSAADAVEICTEVNAPVSRVAATALRRFERQPEQLEKWMENRAMVELRRLNRGLSVLAITANVAPLLGFLGTVTGLMDSFDTLWQYGLSNPGLVALGIKEALTTTAAGLVVAVPAQITYLLLAGRVDRISGDIEAMANVLVEVREEMAATA